MFKLVNYLLCTKEHEFVMVFGDGVLRKMSETKGRGSDKTSKKNCTVSSLVVGTVHQISLE
jgi:hypothetical protein